MAAGNIYCGIGGWTYEPWRRVFYPEGLPHARELSYAAEHLTTIEINGTFYRTQVPATFRKWAFEVPDGFMFSVKGPRYAVNRRVLAEAGDSIKRFLDSGVTELGPHLGPLLWQFTPYKKFDEKDLGKFLELLPPNFDGHLLRDVVEVRNDSFKTPAFIALLRKFGVAVAYAEHEKYTKIADVTADFVYARLQKGSAKLKTGYPPKELDAWAKRAKLWTQRGEPKGLPKVDKKAAPKKVRDAFVYFIHEAKLRAPGGGHGLDRTCFVGKRGLKWKRPLTKWRGYIRRRLSRSGRRANGPRRFRPSLRPYINRAYVNPVTMLCILCLRLVTSRPSPPRC